VGLAVQVGRTYTEGFSFRWDQVDLDHNVIFFGGKTKTEGSSEPVSLTSRAVIAPPAMFAMSDSTPHPSNAMRGPNRNLISLLF
jgi:hypothetical protein